MVSRGSPRSVISGPKIGRVERESLVRALSDIRIIADLLIARSVGCSDADAGDQFTLLGATTIDRVDQGLAALGEMPPPRRRPSIGA